MATKCVQGLQGEDRQVLATQKHYVGRSFSEGGRNHAPVHLGWRELNDDFMLPFEMAVKLGNAGSVMPAYHDIDNEPLHASHHLLTELEPGQSARITFSLPVDMLNFTGYEGVRIVEPGEFELMLVASSSNIKLRTLARVTGTVRKLQRYGRMESQFTAKLL